jgi:hypothetical protein
MSWRDRLAQHAVEHAEAVSRATGTIGTNGNEILSAKPEHPDPDSIATKAIGTIGAIGRKEFSAAVRHRSVREDQRPNHNSSAGVLPDSFAVSAECAVRAETSRPIASKVDAVSAESANSADHPYRSARECDANSAESADSGGVRDASWRDDHEERAAIVEYDGKAPRAWAEGFARLHPARPPCDVPLRRWQTFIDDCGRFLDGGWAGRAAALGWGPFDLFGADRNKPFARIDHAGLLWLLNGNKLIELDRHKAVIQTVTGALQSYRRRPFAVGEVALAWELIASDE